MLEIMNQISAKGIDQLDIYNHYGEIDFNKIKKVPDDFWDTGRIDPKISIEYIKYHGLPAYSEFKHLITSDKEEMRWRDITQKDEVSQEHYNDALHTVLENPKLHHDLLTYGKNALFNYIKHSVRSIDEWKKKNWGTSKNPVDSEKTDDLLWFITYYNSADDIVKELSKKYPDTEFLLLSASKEKCRYAGESSYLNGAAKFGFAYSYDAKALEIFNICWGDNT